MIEENTGWKAGWIRFGWNPAVPSLRKAFTIEKPLATAQLRATALGVYELMLNGRRVGNEALQPGWTDYRKRVYFMEHDVTDCLAGACPEQGRGGENILGAIVAPGWYAGFVGPFEDKGFYGQEAWFSCELVLTYFDGTQETIATDSSWEGHAGPILSSDLLMGEAYDARLELGDWTLPGGKGKTPVINPSNPSGAWGPVAVREDPHPTSHIPHPTVIEPYPGSPVSQVAELPAQSVVELSEGKHVFDLGQNMVGVVRLKLNVPAGTELVLRHGEMLNGDGSVYTANLRKAKAVDRYIAKGEKDETWQPRFTFHGFRYVQIEGLQGTPGLETATGVVLSSVREQIASFECSDPQVNQLFSNINWGFIGNYLDIPTDCPQRDERLGWTGDTQIFMKSASFLADVRTFFDKWLQDLHDAQRADGAYPDIAPNLGRLGHGHAAWADAGIICPYMLWQMYGEIRFAERWWSEMIRYMDFLFTGNNTHNGPEAHSYGDWLSANSQTPNEFIGQAYRIYNCHLMKEMAGALGKDDDVQRFAGLEETARTLFKEKFLDASGHLEVKTQTAYALVVAMDLLDKDLVEKAADDLAQNVRDHDGYLTTGFVGVGYLCPALSRSGRHDLAVQLLLNEGYPSWLYEVKNGATTIWERWNSWSHEDGFGDVSMNSFNHYAFGAVCEWMFESLAGIKAGSPGFQTLEIAPGLTDRLDYVKASYETVHGRVSIHWKKTEHGFEIELETPVEATVRVAGDTWTVESGTWNVVNGECRRGE
ncbi:MAG: family 78 glycoside hydrolase catalytic domain [Verrucomicrobiota bacterium]